jgi:hypothetical protein
VVARAKGPRNWRLCVEQRLDECQERRSPAVSGGGGRNVAGFCKGAKGPAIYDVTCRISRMFLVRIRERRHLRYHDIIYELYINTNDTPVKMTRSGATEDTSDAVSSDVLMVLYPSLAKSTTRAERKRTVRKTVSRFPASGCPSFPKEQVRFAGGRDAQRGNRYYKAYANLPFPTPVQPFPGTAQEFVSRGNWWMSVSCRMRSACDPSIFRRLAASCTCASDSILEAKT